MAENKNLPQHDADHSIKLNPLPKLFGDDGISDNEDDLLQNIVDAGHGKKQASAHKDEKIFSEKFSSAMNHLQSPDSEIKKSRNQYRKTAYAKFVAVLSLLVPLISWVVFQAVLSQESMLSDLIGAHNYGKQLVSLQEEEQVTVGIYQGQGLCWRLSRGVPGPAAVRDGRESGGAHGHAHHAEELPGT